MISAKVVADSISPLGDRLTTIECTFHRFILSELNTHRVFSRNSASSRAIPVQKIVDQVVQNPAVPVKFPREQPGMSGGEEVNASYKTKKIWLSAAMRAAETAQHLVDMKVHKSVVNRLLEPFMWHTAVITSTEWNNFFNQRINEGAQPEMFVLAESMKNALDDSEPENVEYRGWHLPYVTEEELDMDRGDVIATLEVWRQVSVARVAGVSYNRLGKIREIQKDIELYKRLRSASPPHWSPFEHVATPAASRRKRPKGNFYGWHQLRHILDSTDYVIH